MGNQNMTVKQFITDYGLEFCLILFNNFCKENNIARNYKVTKTPLQNRRVERFSRNILDKV